MKVSPKSTTAWCVATIALQFGVLSAGPPIYVYAQPPAAPVQKLEFDVASVKQNKSDRNARSNLSLDSGNVYSKVSRDDVFSPTGGYFSATNQQLWKYIVFAYKLSGTQELALRFNYFSGLSSKAPSWVTGGFNVSADRFDIEARVQGHPTKDQMRLMMQSLLADRFHLVVHTETREAPIFALVLVKPGKTGPHLQPHPATDSCSKPTSSESAPTAAQAPPSWPATVGALPIVCGVIAHVPGRVTTPPPGTDSSAVLRFGGRDVPLGLLATSLPTMTGMATIPRPVLDRTGLTGDFDFTLEWTPEYDAAASQGDTSGSNFRDALKVQLGLKLVPEKGAVDILVIDHIDHPTEN